MVTQEAATSGLHEQQPQQTARYLHVKVVDLTKEDRPAVTIKLPLGVAKWGLTMAKTFSPQMKEANLDWDSINALLQEGAQGEIVNVDDDKNHKTIEVWIE